VADLDDGWQSAILCSRFLDFWQIYLCAPHSYSLKSNGCNNLFPNYSVDLSIFFGRNSYCVAPCFPQIQSPSFSVMAEAQKASNHQKLISGCPWSLAPYTLLGCPMSPDESDGGGLPTAFEPPSGVSEGIKLSGRISRRSQISAVQPNTPENPETLTWKARGTWPGQLQSPKP